MNEKNVVTHKVEGHPGAMIWGLKDEPNVFNLTVTRGKYRASFKLEGKTLEHAMREAKDFLL